jgi:hypothetical protein
VINDDEKRPKSKQIDRSKETKKIEKKDIVKPPHKSGLSKNDIDEDDDEVVEKPKDRDE